MEESLLRDKIVIGISGDITRERLLAEDGLTLDKAIDICRASELAKKHFNIIKD